MRRTLGMSAIAALAAAATAAAALGATQPPRASLQNAICRRSSTALNRAVAITAVMRPLAGTRRMQLQFNLLEKPRGYRSYSSVRGGDLGRWISPANPSLGQRPSDVWRLQKPVVNLAGPAVYRFEVGFRWTALGGRRLGGQYRWGPLCYEP